MTTAIVTESVVRDLAAFRSPSGSALSIYLDLDPSSTPTIPAAEKRFSATLATAEKKVRAERRRAVFDDLRRVKAWWRDEFVRDGAHGVAVFSSSEGVYGSGGSRNGISIAYCMAAFSRWPTSQSRSPSVARQSSSL